ncbi:MAG: hypothetical protein QW717_06665 [Candidatus Bathyarchaeia archaeon]
MYEELFKIWKNELLSKEVGKLPTDFIEKTSDYLKEIVRENKMLDKKTAKASLLKIEEQNVKLMLFELIQLRYRKLVKKASKGERTSGLLAFEEELYSKLSSLTESCQKFVKEVMHGRAVKPKTTRKTTVLLFLKEIPEIIGADLKTYGPFKAEDVATIPNENASILVKQGLAVEVEII